MKEENCIDVKYVYNLSINYLTRFFGAAGKIIHVYKDENSKYVTIVCHMISRNSLIIMELKRPYDLMEEYWTKSPSKSKNGKKIVQIINPLRIRSLKKMKKIL